MDRDKFIAALPDEAKSDVEMRLAILDAFERSRPPLPPLVTVQRVDTGGVASWEVVDRRLPKGSRIVGVYEDELAARAERMKRTPISGGAYVLEAVDTDEYFHDTDYEILGNSDLYAVVGGCGLTYDAADLTVDLAQGAIIHSGSYVAVAAAANAYTLAADGSNERWAALCLSSAGAAVLVSGDPAASSSVEPTKPEIGDRVLIGMAKIQAGQTIANNCEYKLDKRIKKLNYARAKEADETVDGTTLQDDDTYAGWMEANETWVFQYQFDVTTTATADFKIALDVPTGATLRFSLLAQDSGGAAETTRATTTTDASAIPVVGTATAWTVIAWATVINGATAGNATIQWAQNTDDAANVATIEEGGIMTAARTG